MLYTILYYIRTQIRIESPSGHRPAYGRRRWAADRSERAVGFNNAGVGPPTALIVALCVRVSLRLVRVYLGG